MTNISKPFGEAVQAVLEARGWSHQRACVATTVASATIGKMRQGIVPGEDHVIRWAIGIGQDINHWLRLAGYPPIPPELVGLREKLKNPGDVVVVLKEHVTELAPEDIALIERILSESETPSGN